VKYFIWVFALCYVYTSQAQSCCTSQLCNTNASTDIIEDLNYLSRAGIAYGFISDQFALISKINESNSLRYHNQYQHLTLSGRLGITQSFFVQLSMPYKFNTINADNQLSFYNGLGDIKVGLGGNILKAQNNRYAHVLELSADMQMPSGRYYTNNNSLWNSVVISPGNGAFAFNIHLNYRLRHKRIIFSTSGSFNQSFVNKIGLKIGPRFSDDVRIAYLFQRKKIAFIPSFNVGVDYFFKNQLKNKEVTLSGGTLLKAGLSAEIRYGHLSAQLAWNMPFYQHLALGKYQIKQLLSVQLNYLFSIQKKQIKKNKK
jgi:hypothetical protein